MIKDVTLTELRQISDARGAVLHMLRADAADFGGFGECYFSEVLPGKVKAWKRHRVQTQNLAVPVGRVVMVVYDDRPQSQTAGAVDVRELGRPDAYLRVQIPPGLWYGFRCVSGSPAVIANCPDRPHDSGESDTRSPDDPRIPYRWER